MEDNYKEKIATETKLVAEQMRKGGSPEVNAIFMERAVPPFMEILEEQRRSGGNPKEFYDAMVHFSCVVICETLLNIHSRENGGVEIYNSANNALADLAHDIAATLDATLSEDAQGNA